MSKLSGLLFDKNGTLIDFHKSWVAPMWGLADVLAGEDGDLAALLMQEAGLEPATQRVRPDSILSVGTARDLANAWQPFLPAIGGEALVGRINRFPLRAGKTTAEPVLPLETFFGALRDCGLALGVATSDSEASAHALLAGSQSAAHVGFVSGYDSGHGSKAGPGMALAFAEAIAAPPERLAVIGDNLTDLLMGRQAGYGCLIAVLTGTGSEESLAVYADVVLPSIAELKDWLLQEGLIED
ncbi:MAG: HAD family hydrolase [Rhodospirillales bacterium]|nr:HAD family hydrolase [Rhodospirillales bacterium]